MEKFKSDKNIISSEKHCNGCIHWRWFCGRGSNALNACHYILDTGHMRGCAVEECTKKFMKEQ